MRRTVILAALGGTAACLALPISQKNALEPAVDSLRRVPLSFVENRGQWDDSILFVGMQGSTNARLERDRISLDLATGSADGAHNRIRLRFQGASSDVVLQGEEPLSTPFNFLVGEEERWRTLVSAYRRVRYAGIQEGVDLLVREGNTGLRYDLELLPGGDLSAVEVLVDGVDDLTLDESGRLVMEASGKQIAQSPPIAWQTETDGRQRAVECSFRLLSPYSYGFEALSLDPELPLTVDPTVEFATYFYDHDGMAVDAQGCAYVTGSLWNFPTDHTTAHLGNATGDRVSFVAKLDPGASSDGDPATPDSLVFLTVFGGNGGDAAVDLALGPVDSSVFVTGSTSSTDFPTTNSGTLNGLQNAFLLVVDSVTGSTIVSSTLIGGPDTVGVDLVVDDQGTTYLAGTHVANGSGTFPGSPYYQVHGSLGDSDVFLAVLDPVGQLVGSALIGGSFSDHLLEISVLARDGSGNLYVLGLTEQDLSGDPSALFPTTAGAFKTLPAGNSGRGKKNRSSGDQDAFLVRLDPTLSMHYSTLLGGTGGDTGRGIALDGSGKVCVGGRTTSNDFPITNNAIDASLSASRHAFITELDFSGFVSGGAPAMTFSSYFGGDAPAEGKDLIYDSSGNLFIRGSAGFFGEGKGKKKNGGATFPLLGPQIKTGPLDDRDSFLSVLSPNGNGFDLVYSTLIGGDSRDNTGDTVSHSDGSLYLSLSPASENLSTTPNAVFATRPDNLDRESYILKVSSPLGN